MSWNLVDWCGIENAQGLALIRANMVWEQPEQANLCKYEHKYDKYEYVRFSNECLAAGNATKLAIHFS
jgi:hypothetical protein